MKQMEKMRQKRMGNKGFSLVELIIVIAIMAVLIGIVGTQVVPYLNRAREERDMQILNSFSTAAVTFYSLHSEEFAEVNGRRFIVTFLNGSNTLRDFEGTNMRDVALWGNDLKELTGYNSANELKAAMSSAEGKKGNSVRIIYNFGTGPINYGGGAGTNGRSVSIPAGAVAVVLWQNSEGIVLEPVISYIGRIQ